ncbi:MAG TPA: zinc metalloprotease [Actinomycetes bacterium]|nr:zinc metalloprotease [Actinomycetes bacterium]
MRKPGLRSVLSLSVALAAATTMGASAPQVVAAGGAFCDPQVDAQVRAGGVVAARGGTVREPDTGQVHQDLPSSAKGEAGPNFKATVPVYFHVITDGATGSVTDRQVADQVAVLNKTFGGREGGSATGFSFTLAGTDRTDNADWFHAGIGGTNEHTMKQTLRQGGSDALNLYSTSAGAYLGWAYLPDILTKPGQAYLDGVVFNWETIPGVSDTWAGKYDLGETATHEVGHWLNLEHTFYGGCNAHGDYVADTPAQKTATSGCPAGKDTCKEPGLDPIHNYMDYSYDSCYTEFTAGQTQRMRDAWLFYRA